MGFSYIVTNCKFVNMIYEFDLVEAFLQLVKFWIIVLMDKSTVDAWSVIHIKHLRVYDNIDVHAEMEEHQHLYRRSNVNFQCSGKITLDYTS